MDLRNRIGLYGSYFFGMAAIGFTLPYLPLYLGEKGLSPRAIGIVSSLAALAGVLQFPVGMWSDRIGWRKPFLIAALAAASLSTWLLPSAQGLIWVSILVIFFAENGISRSVVESLAGAEATSLAGASGVGAALGALRFWKPIGIVIISLIGSYMAEHGGIGTIFLPLSITQGLAFACAFLIHEDTARSEKRGREPAVAPKAGLLQDTGLLAFIAAMIFYHAANAPGGVYLSLFLRDTLHAPGRMPAYAFAVSMVAWMLVVVPAGKLADTLGRKPMLVAGWVIMVLRLVFVALAQTPWQVVLNQALDGLGNGIFAVIAAAWVTDRLGDPRRSGEAQAIVGCSLVFGSAVGPAITGFLVEPLGYRNLFWVLAGIGSVATAILILLVPETLKTRTDLESKDQAENIVAVPGGILS
jgi:MFS family permease